MKKLMIALLTMLLCCSQAHAPSPPVTPPVTLRVLPVLVTEADGDHGWRLKDWDVQLRYARLVWSQANVAISDLPMITLGKEELRIVDTDADMVTMMLLAFHRYKQSGVVTVFLVQNIQDKDGMQRGGFGMFPWYLPPWNQGVWIVQHPSPDTLAHELGHYLGLKHTWQDAYQDTTPSDACNVMDYTEPCWELPPGETRLSKEQIRDARWWMRQGARIEATDLDADIVEAQRLTEVLFGWSQVDRN